MSPSVIKAPRLCASPSAITKMSGVDGTNRMDWWRLVAVGGAGGGAPLYNNNSTIPCRVKHPSLSTSS